MEIIFQDQVVDSLFEARCDSCKSGASFARNFLNNEWTLLFLNFAGTELCEHVPVGFIHEVCPGIIKQ